MTPTLLVPFTGGVQVEFVYSLGGKLAVNRIWLWNVNEDTDQALMDELAPLVSDFWCTSLMPALSADLRLELVRCTSWDDPLSPLVSFTTPLVSGGVAEPSHSANVAIRVSFKPPSNVPMRPGGNFVPGIPTSEVDVNEYSFAMRVALFDHYVALIDAARTWGATEPWYWMCVSLVNLGALRSNMLFGTVIGPIFPTPWVTQQRHRLKA